MFKLFVAVRIMRRKIDLSRITCLSLRFYSRKLRYFVDYGRSSDLLLKGAFPSALGGQWLKVPSNIVELTAAGTVQDLHLIPFQYNLTIAFTVIGQK